VTRREFGLSFRYRLLFYLGSFIFATATYVFGVWAYAAESASWGDIELQRALARNLSNVLQSHLTTFYLWQVMCMIIAGVIGHMMDKEAHYRRRAESRANRDGLTDTYNHRYFQERLAVEIERAGRYGRELSLMMLDLDYFKAFNDTYGHQEGDKLLKWFVALCERCIRGIDVLARYGGEEFVVILPETGTEEALAVAERVRQAAESESKNVFRGDVPVTVSVGIAGFPIHAKTRHALVLNADAALYYAKQMGRNTSVVYEEGCRRTYRAVPGHVKQLLAQDDVEAIEALAAAVDARDSFMKGHSGAVAETAVTIGEKLGVSVEELGNLRIAALLHDLGKIGTPDDILGKQAPLRDEEWRLIENHSGLGSSILKRVQQMGGAIVAAVKHHHERFDGKGYPGKLSGASIPLLARIIAVADAYDAMTNTRSYRKAMTADEAIDELRRCAGSQFDPQVVEAFVAIMQQREKEAA